MALHYLQFGKDQLSHFNQTAFVFSELSTFFYLVFFFILVKPICPTKNLYIAAASFFCVGGLVVLLFLLFSLVPSQRENFHIVFKILSYLTAVRLFLVVFFVIAKAANCGEYKLVPSDLNGTEVTYFQSSKLVSFGYTLVSIIICTGPILFIILGVNSKVPILLHMGGLIDHIYTPFGHTVRFGTVQKCDGVDWTTHVFALCTDRHGCCALVFYHIFIKKDHFFHWFK